MRTQNSIIFAISVVLLTTTGCGVKRDLYQTPEKPPAENAETDANHSKAETLHQQEK